MEVSINNILIMKISVVLLFLMLFINCKTVSTEKTKNLNNYRARALDLIISSDNTKKYSITKNNIRVSEELIPFHDIGMFFLDSLLQEGFGKLEFSDLNNYSLGIKMELKELTTNKKSNIHFFFSNEIKDIFFIELVLDDRKLIRYEEATASGYSIGFMFKQHEKSITLIGSVKIHHG